MKSNKSNNYVYSHTVESVWTLIIEEFRVVRKYTEEDRIEFKKQMGQSFVWLEIHIVRKKLFTSSYKKSFVFPWNKQHDV